MEFKDRIKNLRTEKGLTMQELADQMNTKYGTNITRATISRYESGSREPVLHIAKYFCLFFNCSFDYLIGLVDKKEEKFGVDYVVGDNILIERHGDKIKVKVKKK